jgi:hypothetical protein
VSFSFELAAINFLHLPPESFHLVARGKLLQRGWIKLIFAPFVEMNREAYLHLKSRVELKVSNVCGVS